MSAEPDASLTLDMEARARATKALGDAFERGHRNHYCDEWLEDGTCTICWAIAWEIILAAEGLQRCSRCNAMGIVGPEGDSCPECGGIGIEPQPIRGPREEDPR